MSETRIFGLTGEELLREYCKALAMINKQRIALDSAQLAHGQAIAQRDQARAACAALEKEDAKLLVRIQTLEESLEFHKGQLEGQRQRLEDASNNSNQAGQNW